MYRILILLVLLIHPIGEARAAEKPLAYGDIASTIKARFECSLFRLSLPTQVHWAIRLYRASGDSSYQHAILSGALLAERNLLRDLAGWDDPSYRSARGLQLLEQFNGKGRKARSRRELFEARTDVLIMLSVLSSVKRLDELGLAGSLRPEDTDAVWRIINTKQLADFLLDEEVLRTYAAQAVNYIYYLEQLAMVDLRTELVHRFQETFPDQADTSLSRLQFKDKVYGLTHFILAASGYFQHEVPREDSAWILAYFDRNLDRILDETKEDIIAEVGLCYLLAGDEESSSLARCRQALATSYEGSVGLIPSVSGRIEPETGEHRNVLACLLLDWPKRLHPGPDLGSWAEATKLLAP